MKKIGQTIIEEGIVQTNNLKTRTTARAIIINQDKVLLLYSKKYDDYTTPGGGIKENENYQQALVRELKEELGVRKVKIIQEIGYTVEIRFGLSKKENIYQQKSFYYLCQIDSIGQPSFVKREAKDLLIPKWIKIGDAINYNNAQLKKKTHLDKGFKTVLKRENMVLGYVLKVD